MNNFSKLSVKFLSKSGFFYTGCLIVCGLLYLFTAINSYSSHLVFTITNIFILVFTALLAEKIITVIYKGPLVEVRLIIFLLLLLSPYFQFYLSQAAFEYFSIFFMMFAFFNYALFEKSNEKGFILISVFSILFSTYFYAYSLIALLPLLVINFLKAKWTGLLYTLTFLIAAYLLYYYNYLNFNFIFEWEISNFFSSGLNSSEYKTLNIIFSFFPFFHPAFMLAGILAIPFARRYDIAAETIQIMVISIFLYLFFIAGLSFQHFNMLIITFPLIIILFYPAFTRIINLTEYFRPTLKKYFPFLIMFLQVFFYYLITAGFMKVNI